ncbi:hypothetical protein D9M73_124260 [compost metagenome]
MLANALHLDPVAAIGEHVADRLVGRHLAALLVDHDAFDRLGEADRAAIGFQFAGQQLEQGRFACTVRADDADAVLARHAQRQIADDGAVAKRLGDMLGVDHHLGARIVAANGEVGRPLRPDHRRAFGAHLDQLGQPPLVALAPPGDAAQQPMLLQFQLGVELFGIALFVGIDLLGPSIEAAKADFGAPQIAAVHPQGLLGQLGQEGAVMADDDKGTAKALEPFLDPFDRANVEVVGRLVEQQHIGILREGAHDRRPAALAARGLGRFAREINAELVGNRLGFIALRRIVARQHIIGERRKARHRRFLLELDHARARHDRAPPLVGIDLAAEQLEQGRLARAVAPDQRQPVARPDMNIEPTEQPARALNDAEIFICENWCSHEGGVTGIGACEQAGIPRSHREREGPAARRWEGEDDPLCGVHPDHPHPALRATFSHREKD